MAEDKAKPKRRMVKKAETVREKQAKALQPKQPKKPGVVRLALHYIAVPFRFVAAPFKWIGRQFAKLGRFLYRFKVVRVLAKVLRFIGRILWPRYFRNSWRELRLVTWPNRRETWQLTSAVIIFSVIFGLLVAVVDYGLDKLFKQLIIK